MDSATDLISDYKLIQSSQFCVNGEGRAKTLSNILVSLSIDTIVIDRHRGVGALHISHQYDIWHMAKSVVKQLSQKGELKHSEHRSSPFLTIYGGLHKHVMGMQHSLLKRGHQ